jgi:2-polyprenyl-3-methyl-5-hydroxy-6-metoxy-1,4-benzoquinol methylase
MHPGPAAASLAAMSTTTHMATTAHDGYVLGRSTAEYERLRAQARVWEEATGRLLDHVGLAPGASCLDAGCGPGETMRLMAQRVGPAGYVRGVDVDARLGAQALTMLRSAGHLQCTFEAADVEEPCEIPGAPFDLVYARLLLFHVTDPAAVLARLWTWVAPGGHLVVQDYDLRTSSVTPPLAAVDEFNRLALGAMAAAGRDIHVGHRLPLLFSQAGLGVPDGTDVAGRLEPLATAGAMLASVVRSVLPTALALGLTTPDDVQHWFDALAADAAAHGDHQVLWPLLIGAWKRKPGVIDIDLER